MKNEELSIYKCNICGNIVEVIQDGGGTLVCCGEEMEKQMPQTEEQAYSEKHVPKVTFEEDNDKKMVKIVVGEVEHPMLEEHFIKFIEAYSIDGVYLKRKMLSPNEQPELHFLCNCDEMVVRAYCNLHGLWQTTYKK